MVSTALACIENDLKHLKNAMQEFIATSKLDTGATPDGQKLHERATQAYLLEPIKRAFLSGGKLMRPLLCAWTWRTLSHDFSPESTPSRVVSEVGLGVEMLHSASLVIDDVQDHSHSRRGKPSLHVEIGEALAINTGSWMYFEAMRLLEEHMPSQLIHQTLLNCHHGQALDLGSKKQELVDWAILSAPAEREEFYQRIAELKTAELIRVCVKSLALTISGSRELSEKYETLMTETGLLYQIVDDLRNLSPTLSGGKQFEDLGSLRSLVAIRLVDRCDPAQCEELRGLARRSQQEMRDWIVQHPDFPAAARECVASAHDRMAKLKTLLGELAPESVAQEYFAEIILMPLKQVLLSVESWLLTLGVSPAVEEQMDNLCKRLTQVHGQSFYLASHVLKRSSRHHAYWVYALCRLVDDATDEPSPHAALQPGAELSERLIAHLFSPSSSLLSRDEMEHLADLLGRTTGQVISPEDAGHFLTLASRNLKAMGITEQPFRALVQGQKDDEVFQRPKNFDEFYLYCYRVAGVVGHMMARVFQARSDQETQLAAEHLGIAMQITNILRDVREDLLEKKRIYLPEEQCSAFGVDVPAALRAKSSEAPQGWDPLVEHFGARAIAYYRSAEQGVASIPGWGERLCVRAMIAIYGAILTAILRSPRRPLRERVIVPRRTRLWILLKVLGGLNPLFACGLDSRHSAKKNTTSGHLTSSPHGQTLL